MGHRSVPRDPGLPGKKIVTRQEIDAPGPVPQHPTSLLRVLETLEPLRDQFPPVDELSIEAVEL